MGTTEVNKMPNTNRTGALPENFVISERLGSPAMNEKWLSPVFRTNDCGAFTGDGGTGKTQFTLQLLLVLPFERIKRVGRGPASEAIN
jgi:hypothetical protein